VQKLILKLAYEHKGAETIAYTTRLNFDKLPKEFREPLLVKLADKDTAAGEVGDALLYHFENLSEEVKLHLNIREQLMFKLANI
jgi:hypothetical protein